MGGGGLTPDLTPATKHHGNLAVHNTYLKVILEYFLLRQLNV